MTTEADILNGAYSRLASTSGLTADVAWPNEPEPSVLPRYEVSLGPGATETLTFDGYAKTTLTMIVAAVVKAGTYTATADAMAQAVIDRFPVGTIVGEGLANVTRRPRRGSGYQDGTLYRVPVTIFLNANLAP